MNVPMTGINSQPTSWCRLIWRTSCVLALATLLTSATLACPTCKDALAENGGGGDLVRGFGWSIIFMLSMPFLILASLGGYFWLLVRRAARLQAAGVPSPNTTASILVQELVVAEREHHEHQAR